MISRLFIAPRFGRKILAGFLLLCIFGGGFYWFQLRPSQSKAECSAKSRHEVTEASKMFPPDEEGRVAREDIEYLLKLQEQIYQFCLREKGI